MERRYEAVKVECKILTLRRPTSRWSRPTNRQSFRCLFELCVVSLIAGSVVSPVGGSAPAVMRLVVEDENFSTMAKGAETNESTTDWSES